MEIRSATVADVPLVLPMVDKIAALHQALDPAKYGFLSDVGQMYEGWLEARAADSRSVFLVAERGGKLVAFLIATIEREIPIYTLKEYGFIHDVWVEPMYRNEGIARQLTTLAIERFTETGVKQIRLDTASSNDTARHLFQRCGFRPSTTEMLIEL